MQRAFVYSAVFLTHTIRHMAIKEILTAEKKGSLQKLMR